MRAPSYRTTVEYCRAQFSGMLLLFRRNIRARPLLACLSLGGCFQQEFARYDTSGVVGNGISGHVDPRRLRLRTRRRELQFDRIEASALHTARVVQCRPFLLGEHGAEVWPAAPTNVVVAASDDKSRHRAHQTWRCRGPAQTCATQHTWPPPPPPHRQSLAASAS